VPASVGAALLFVETRLGKHTGRENAFYSLASMSTKFPVENIMGYVDSLTDAQEHSAWVESRMEEKSEWAYKELKALLTYCDENGLDPHSIPGSVYGAIGMCQFIPTSISRFAEDGNGDGIIDLFNASDSILSLSRYLSLNGWRKGLTLDGQVKVLMRYNKMLKYAHTILALARTIENLDKPSTAKQTASKKKALKSSAVKGRKATPHKTKVSPSPKAQKRWVTAKGRDITTIVD
jgi:membrane-bound lytic murein transglycosylase B